MAARSKARKRAVDVLYEADVRGADPEQLLAERLAQADPPVPDYAVELVEGVTGNLGLIDEVLGEHSEGWSVDRMPP
ncbi:MAG TPA: transcription antitermination factor NusB, partial [Mycobacteriales bacterium]|nr:transcription antitermination factor NusB [Mycobacteriales bacterium]